MSIHKISNVFSDKEILTINNLVNNVFIPKDKNKKYVSYDVNHGTGIHESLGRLQISTIFFPQEFKNKITEVANQVSGKQLTMSHGIYAEYSSKYGEPNLPPHFDYDTNDLVIDFQLSSNISWDLGIDLKTYALEDNSALVFNANHYIHWRPHKVFKDEDYVKMLFFRFYDPKNKSDYSSLNYSQDSKIFQDIRSFRDNLKENI